MRAPRRASPSGAAPDAYGNREVEGAAHADLALRPDAAAVRVDDAPRDVQTEAESSVVVLADLPEAFEYRLEHVARYAGAGVDHRHAQLVSGAFGANFDAAAARGELHRVRDEIREDL